VLHGNVIIRTRYTLLLFRRCTQSACADEPERAQRLRDLMAAPYLLPSYFRSPNNVVVRGRDCSLQRRFPIVDISFRSGDIRDYATQLYGHCFCIFPGVLVFAFLCVLFLRHLRQKVPVWYARALRSLDGNHDFRLARVADE